MGERHDKITFDEHVYALYADFKHPLSDKWDLRTGLRMEYTHTAGKNNGRRLENLRSYLNVFPTLFLGFNPNDRHAFSLNGTVRLNRPHFGQLSPFASYENQYSVMRGKKICVLPSVPSLLSATPSLGRWTSSSTVAISGMASHRSSASIP